MVTPDRLLLPPEPVGSASGFSLISRFCPSLYLIHRFFLCLILSFLLSFILTSHPLFYCVFDSYFCHLIVSVFSLLPIVVIFFFSFMSSTFLLCFLFLFLLLSTDLYLSFASIMSLISSVVSLFLSIYLPSQSPLSSPLQFPLHCVCQQKSSTVAHQRVMWHKR